MGVASHVRRKMSVFHGMREKAFNPNCIHIGVPTRKKLWSSATAQPFVTNSSRGAVIGYSAIYKNGALVAEEVLEKSRFPTKWNGGKSRRLKMMD